MAEQAKIESGRSRRIMQGTNLAVYTVVGVAILVAINWFSNQHVKRWDFTQTKKYSLSPQTVKMVKDLKDNVTIYAFDHKERFQAQADVLNLFTKASNKVTLRYIDPTSDPALAKQLGVQHFGTIVVAVGERHDEAQTADEQGISNALIRVLKQQTSVYFIQGHGEKDPAGADVDGMMGFKKALESENDTVKTVDWPQNLGVPKDADVVVIAGPKHDYLPQEIDTIRTYLQGGGRVMAFLDAGLEMPNLGKLLSEYNVNLQNDLVIDTNPVAQMFGTGPETPLILKYGTSPITEPLQRTVTAFPLTRSFDVGKDYKSGISVATLCQTSDRSFGVQGWTPAVHEIRPSPGKDLKGPLTVAVAIDTTTSGEGKGSARLVAMGTSAIAANQAFNFEGDKDLLMNSVDWLTANESMMSIRPKPTESQHLNLTADQMTWLLIRLAAIPVVIIIAGIVVWWGRR